MIVTEFLSKFGFRCLGLFWLVAVLTGSDISFLILLVVAFSGHSWNSSMGRTPALLSSFVGVFYLMSAAAVSLAQGCALATETCPSPFIF